MSEEYLKMTGFDEAIIGLSEGIEPKIVYDMDKLVEILMTRDKMTEEDALEYLSYNVISAYVGEKTPIIVRKCDLSYIEEISDL